MRQRKSCDPGQAPVLSYDIHLLPFFFAFSCCAAKSCEGVYLGEILASNAGQLALEWVTLTENCFYGVKKL